MGKKDWLLNLKVGDEVLCCYGLADKPLNVIRERIVRITKCKIIIDPPCHYSRITGKRWGESPWGNEGVDEIRPCN